MRKVNLLDCTLRDGGYINDWRFGKNGIKEIIKKLAQTGIEMIEVGFIRGETYDPDRTLFPDIEAFKNVISEKNEKVLYLGMIDMSAPVSIDQLSPYDGTSIDGIRVIFKKDKMDEAYVYCAEIKKLGYKLFVNFVSTDAYTDKEFIEGIERFNAIRPEGMAIVDTFGMIKRKHFKRLVSIADHNMAEDIMLCYHAHNNLQQAFGNAESMVEMNLSRDVCIDACVFGMGRGAGNLNLELFAEHMNDNYGTNYRITPMLEIMDEYLLKFYRTKFWGYSLPLYLSASLGCHPNYAIYYAEKNALTEKAFHELLQSISIEDKSIFSKEKADKYYRQYLEIYIDDKAALEQLEMLLRGQKIFVIAPGKSLQVFRQQVLDKIKKENAIVISVNFFDEVYGMDFCFISNMRRFAKMGSIKQAKVIATSNIREAVNADYTVNCFSFVGKNKEIFDNAGLMTLRLLGSLGVREVTVAGMDGYSSNEGDNYFNNDYEREYLTETDVRNELITSELKEIQKYMDIHFLTPTRYKI